MNRRQRRTLLAIWSDPTPSNIDWRDIESLLLSVGAAKSEGRGSRVRFTLNGRALVLHRPHPSPVLKKYAVRHVRDFLEGLGIIP